MAGIITRSEIVTKNGQHHVRFLAGNGEVILWSENYTDRGWAERVAAELDVPSTFVIEAAEDLSP